MAIKREIFYCNIHVKHKNKVIVLKEMVTKEIEGNFWHKSLEKYKVKEPLPIVKVEIIKSLGFENS